ncbi:Cof-type HAD-IIB family hydrolase [Pontibacillus litoralis]|uniref:HAD family hydrolase n=1 Tax=Pontibacillus litoralis JSM 072002 TaxID=1385512 RepID=A0A0A5HWW8_9BACI|nr:Cof-type HAD-IIB family hydrolase [Pontibacillus litoralis]KGX88127.1 HAD family hydrolase [Pontibacillus litoralis JSM 072002]
MIKLLVCDLDGTLIDGENKVKQQDVQAIQDAIDNGITLAIASGRMDHEIKAVLELLEQKENGHRVSQNGAFIYDKEGQAILSNTFPPEKIQELFRSTLGEDILTTVSTATDTYVLEDNLAAQEVQKRLFHKLIIEPDMLTKLGTEINPSKIAVFGKTDRLKALQKEIDATYDHYTESYISDPMCLDLMPKHISKGAAVKKLMQMYGYNPEEIACVGDSYNDLSMFELTPNSFAMPQAEDAVKEKATHVITDVADAIHYLLKKPISK